MATSVVVVGTITGMDDPTRLQRIAQRFLISILQQPGPEAPAVLRAWADGLEALAEEETGHGDEIRCANRARTEKNLFALWSH